MIRMLLAIALTAATGTSAAAADDVWSPDAQFQAGTSYASAGHPGRAILAFERAELLAPRDAAIRAELARTREAAGIVAPVPSRAHAALGVLTSDEWVWLALAGGALACAGAVGFAWSIRRPAARTAALAGAVIAALALTAALSVAPSKDDGVVVRGEVARISPVAAADAAFTAPEGEGVQIEQERGDFVYVRDGDRAGWLPRDAVERVLAAEPAGAHT